MAGAGETRAVLFDLDDVLVPFQTVSSWQWAWRPQGPRLVERHARTALRRAQKAWDRRRWLGLSRKVPPADLTAWHEHLAATLRQLAGHAVAPAESDAVVRRFLRPAGEVERFADAAPALERLRARGTAVGVLTSLPGETARWLLHRTGLAEELLLGTGDGPAPAVPARAAFRGAAERLGAPPDRTAFVGDLYWSDVRAAQRAGLVGILVDRAGLWPAVRAGRIEGLDGLEAALAIAAPAGPAPPGASAGGSPEDLL